jgi:hypothetical protein
MNTTTHPVAPENIMAYLDCELPPGDAQALSAHLDRCTECSLLTEQLHNASLSLSNWRVETVPVKIENSIADLVARPGSDLKSNKGYFFLHANFWTWKQWAMVGGGTLATLLLVTAISVPALHRSRQTATSTLYVDKRKTVNENYDSGSAARPQIRARLVDPEVPITGQQSKVFQAPTVERRLDSLVTLSQPDIAADSNGLFHGLGDHAPNSFSVDGQPTTYEQSKVISGPMIARTVSLSIVVKDFAASRSSLDRMLQRHHGYSAQMSVSTPENAPRSLQASLRIPERELSQAVVDLRTLGRVENESQSGEEVTEQHADLVARLKTSRETEQRFRTILVQRAGKVAEVLQVEEGIARVRGDIERMEAEQKALEHRVDFATVELQLMEEFKAQLNPPSASVSTRIHNAFVAGYSNALETVLGIALFFTEYGPAFLIWLGIIIGPAIFVWRRYRKALASV